MRYVKLTHVVILGVTVPVELPAIAVEDEDDEIEVNAKVQDVVLSNLHFKLVPQAGPDAPKE